MRLLVAFFVVLICQQPVQSQTTAQTLDVVCWNIEWFGSTANGPSNKNVQEQNVAKVLKYLDADIYGLTEVVDTARFRTVVDSLGTTRYSYFISDVCSFAVSPADANWLTGQKLAFVYDKQIFSNVRVRTFVTNSTKAYSNFASGRLPFLLQANATIGGITRPINFILIHGKSGAGSSDYARRQGGAVEMRDSIEVQFANDNNFIIGDYNDDLQTTISASAIGQTISSYDVIVRDSAKYKSLSIELSRAGDSSTLGYSSVIDNHIVSAKMATAFVPNSVKVRRDILNTVPDYRSGNTSDHWPVSSRYILGNIPTAVTTTNTYSANPVKIYPNPCQQLLHIDQPLNISVRTITVKNAVGAVVLSKKSDRAANSTTLDLSFLPPGIYFIEVIGKGFTKVEKLVKF